MSHKKPDVLKKIEGTWRADRSNPNEPEFDATNIQVPDHFNPAEKAKWFEMVPMLIRAGVMTDADVYAAEMLVQKFVEWQAAQVMLHETSPIVRSPNGFPMVSPYFSISEKLGKEVRQLLAEFGMAPASRSRVGVSKAAGAGDRVSRLVRKK